MSDSQNLILSVDLDTSNSLVGRVLDIYFSQCAISMSCVQLASTHTTGRASLAKPRHDTSPR